jgi:hypothetical protein
MTAAYEEQALIQDLYREMGCEPSLCGSDGKARGLRAKVDKTYQYFHEVMPSVSYEKQALKAVRDKWTAGLGPVSSYLMWMAIRFLVTRVVSFLWKRYTS